MKKTTLEDIGDIDFTCVLPPDFNFLTKKQN